jgi:hypothetical protein
MHTLVVRMSVDPARTGEVAQGPRRYPQDAARAWNIADVTVYEQLASA